MRLSEWEKETEGKGISSGPAEYIADWDPQSSQASTERSERRERRRRR